MREKKEMETMKREKYKKREKEKEYKKIEKLKTNKTEREITTNKKGKQNKKMERNKNWKEKWGRVSKVGSFFPTGLMVILFHFHFCSLSSDEGKRWDWPKHWLNAHRVTDHRDGRQGPSRWPNKVKWMNE